MADNILGNIFLGDIEDATDVWEGDMITCTQTIRDTVPIRTLWIPIIRQSGNTTSDRPIAEQGVDVIALKSQLDLASQEIEKRFQNGTKTLVHCIGGMERSPLAIAYWLHKERGFTYDGAYDYIQKIRPQVLNRLIWLNLNYDEHMS